MGGLGRKGVCSGRAGAAVDAEPGESVDERRKQGGGAGEGEGEG